MLNVLRHLDPPERPLKRWWWPLLAGLLLSMCGTFWLDPWAEFEIATLLLEKTTWEAAMQSHQTQPAHSELDGLQFSLTQATQRVQALHKRQSMRLDLQEVQALLFAKKPIRNHNAIQLQKLRWQGGRFEWEGLSLSPEAVQGLLLQTSTFDRWEMQPQLVQIQSSSSTQSSPASQSVIFKLEGQIQFDALPSNVALQQP